ncbi:NAD(P)-dependent oxidoreductase [Massilia sp. DJPM01]|uniref:NAD(P)-dependent oxidoreductase n=1 Tax=Massilia sp. DJPM01 TaxID=3024404 RepID=UPI00259EDEF2|nr:NAD(P)-dependent oxidoreductase [Massilia sp. DJPM01]MDM5179969.1 NAD(P)-dependent oxidoreductase [Massilia sp. DJPM01]
MNIVLIGATGFIGTALLNEALNRGHAVSALSTRPDKLAPRERLQARAVDVMDVAALTAQLAGADAVLSAFSGHAQGDVQAYYVSGARNIIAAVKEARVPRLLMVGGAGSLEVAPGAQLLDSPDFPEQYRASAEGARQSLALLRAEASLDWTMLSPAAMISPGQRSGVFRLGGNALLLDAAGKSAISVEDYAVAMIDELEKPAHSRQRFTVAY